MPEPLRLTERGEGPRRPAIEERRVFEREVIYDDDRRSSGRYLR